jgi:hypothetical protein
MDALEMRKIAALCAANGARTELSVDGLVMTSRLNRGGEVSAETRRVVRWEDLFEARYACLVVSDLLAQMREELIEFGRRAQHIENRQRGHREYLERQAK